MEQWRKKAIGSAILHLTAITQKAKGKDTICAISQQDCEKFRIYLDTWVIPSLEKAIQKKRTD